MKTYESLQAYKEDVLERWDSIVGPLSEEDFYGALGALDVYRHVASLHGVDQTFKDMRTGNPLYTITPEGRIVWLGPSAALGYVYQVGFEAYHFVEVG